MARRTQSGSKLTHRHDEPLVIRDADNGQQSAWQETDEATELTLPQATPSIKPEAGSLSDSTVARYFADVQRFTLLSREEEEALWNRIDRHHQRCRRALYLSPTALTTLKQLWQQIEHGDLPFESYFANQSDQVGDLGTQSAQIRTVLTQLQKLQGQLDKLRRQSHQCSVALSRQRRRRQQQTILWRQWITLWEALDLQQTALVVLQDALAQAFNQSPHDPVLRASHSVWLCAQRREKQSKTEMMQANLRLVIHIANRYRGRGVAFPDLIQEGNLGLMRALDKFEARRGLKFITYAYWWVRQAIGRAIINQYRTVRVPNHIVERKQKLRSTEERLWTDLGRQPTLDELSTALEWSPEEIEELQVATQPILQLQQSGTETESVLEDVLADEQREKPDQLLATAQLQRHLAACLSALTEREADILRLRYGFDSDRPHTLQEIGALFGLSRERIRQIEQIALKKLRQPQLTALLADYAPA